MRTLYVEGLAIHDDPESCVDVREDGGEALTGVRAGWAIEPRNQGNRVPTLLNYAEGNIGGSESQAAVGPRRSKNLCMYGVSMRENREIPHSPVGSIFRRAARARPRPQS